MPLSPGARVGPYEVVSALGAGGMGEVYRAHDTKLGRDVALKILPEMVAADPDRLARFQREAQLLAALNHPNIAQIYGLEESGSQPALVLELVEGSTLADRIAAGPVRCHEALAVASQIAEALEAAHEAGVIHRDLKPANIKLKPHGEDGDWTVKVLDFGLAKAFDQTSDGDPSHSPTLTAAATRAGVIMGTAAYMAPEQARGKPVDRRADIWAFGCVLYEMFTGTRPFDGDGVTDTIAFIITREPDWNRLPPDVPAAVRRLLRRCLMKERKDRLRDIGDALVEIREARAIPPTEIVAVVPPPPIRPRPPMAFVALALVLVGALSAGVAWFARQPVAPRVARFLVATPDPNALWLSPVDRSIAISPDGDRIVYVGANGSRLFVRSVDQLQPTALSGLGVPRNPFVSPDGQWIGFYDATTWLKKVAMSGGPPTTLTRINGSPRGATWGADDTIIFATLDPTTGLLRVRSAGGDPEVLTRPDRAQGEQDHQWPEYLPGNRGVLFTILPTAGSILQAQVAVLDLRTGNKRVLVRGGSSAAYVASGHVIYGSGDGTVRAVPFDLDNLEVTGPVVPIVDGVVTVNGVVNFAVGSDGTFVYVPGGLPGGTLRKLVWIGRDGREEVLAAPGRPYFHPRLSPDGSKAAIYVGDDEQDIWIWDFRRQTLTRLTIDPGQDLYPVWTPDSKRLLFASARDGPANLYWQAADGSGAVERLTTDASIQYPYSFSPDGKSVVLRQDTTAKSGQDLMLFTLDGDRRVTPLVQTSFDELNGEISPNGRWLAFESGESGQPEVFVRPFPGVNEGRWQVSFGGGVWPLWSRDGKELLYLSSDGALMSAAVEQGGAFSAGQPKTLFKAGTFMSPSLSPGRNYDISKDGQRFLAIRPGATPGDQQMPASFVVVEHWFEELRRLIP